MFYLEPRRLYWQLWDRRTSSFVVPGPKIWPCVISKSSIRLVFFGNQPSHRRDVILYAVWKMRTFTGSTPMFTSVFQTAYKMMSRRCVVAEQVSPRKPIVYLFFLYSSWNFWKFSIFLNLFNSYNYTFTIFLHASYMSLSCKWWQSYFFHNFWKFFIVFDKNLNCTEDLYSYNVNFFTMK